MLKPRRKGFWDAPSHYTHIEALAWAAGHNQAGDKSYAIIKIVGARLSYNSLRPPPRKAECGDVGFALMGDLRVRHDWWIGSPLSPGYQRRVGMNPLLVAPYGSQWKPITDLPTESGGYWVWEPGRPDRDWVGHWAYRADLGRWGSYGDCSPKRGSYWMPLPKPPVTSF